MAEVAGQPFLTYVIRRLLSHGIERFIFSLGYNHKFIEAFLESQFSYLQYSFVVEEHALGTGGAIRLALTESSQRDVLIVNADALFKIDLENLFDRHIEFQSDCTVALFSGKHDEIYGGVRMDKTGRINSIYEGKLADGCQNGGVYILNTNRFLKYEFPEVFSFEKDYLEAYLSSSYFFGVIQKSDFIQIGIPEDYKKAEAKLKYPSLPFEDVNTGWTLFLDRDGVINYNKDESYIFSSDEFSFIPGVIEAIQKLSVLFGKIVIVTNQRGVGKGLMTEVALCEVHQYMLAEIENGGGRIDAVYYCTQIEDKHHDRKPNPGMALEAAHMFPDINFSQSIMVGDKLSDMQFGRNIGSFTVLIASYEKSTLADHADVDAMFESLSKFSKMV